MADERSLGVARARESGEESSSLDLEHRMDEARESITDAVSEINEASVNQDDSVADHNAGVSGWDEHLRKHPIAFGLGALGVGLLVGYGLAGIIEGEDESDSDPEDIHEAHVQIEGGGPSAFTDHHSYAAHARAVARVDEDDSALREHKPGIIGRFKETRAYDRLHEEVSDLGSRFVDGLADTARSVVLPAIIGTIREFIGIDPPRKRTSSDAANLEPKDMVAEDGSIPLSAVVAIPGITPSESGKPAYPKSRGSSINKIDRLASDKSANRDESESSPRINLNYDDRYERESRLFSRGEMRAFDPVETEQKKSNLPDGSSTGNDDIPRGRDFTYEAGDRESN